MNKEMINKIIKFEVKYIPKGSKRSTQNKTKILLCCLPKKRYSKGLIKRSMSQRCD